MNTSLALIAASVALIAALGAAASGPQCCEFVNGDLVCGNCARPNMEKSLAEQKQIQLRHYLPDPVLCEVFPELCPKPIPWCLLDPRFCPRQGTDLDRRLDIMREQTEAAFEAFRLGSPGTMGVLNLDSNLGLENLSRMIGR